MSTSWSKLLFLRQQLYSSEGHLADNLLMRFINFGLLWYFEVFAGFWATCWKATITSGSCMAVRTSGSLRIVLSPGIPAIPGIPPGKSPGKEPCWAPDCPLVSSSLWAVSCSSQAFLALSILYLTSCSSCFCSSFFTYSAIFRALGWTFFSMHKHLHNPVYKHGQDYVLLLPNGPEVCVLSFTTHKAELN